MSNSEKQRISSPKWYDIKGQLSHRWQQLLHQKASPHSIAYGLALGIFIGFLPIMGVQMAVVLFFSLIFRGANKPAAVVGVWISNPLTVLPIYAFNYLVGILLYPVAVPLTYDAMKEALFHIFELHGPWAQTVAFLSLGADIFIPMFLGGGVIGVVAMIPTYYFTKRAIKRIRRKRNAKKTETEN
ncbi:DUF2062 domain-containing protein [bacterium]|nr:DUF2062 domain-containing protein [bacterium]